MLSVRVLQQLLLLLVCFTSVPLATEMQNHLLTAPHPDVVEIGTNFTASCAVVNTTEVTADDLYWQLAHALVPRERYTKTGGGGLNVTLQVSGETQQWLYCLGKKARSPYVMLNKGKFIHGILLRKAYRPMRPENLSCVAVQEKNSIAPSTTPYIAPSIACEWNASGRQTKDVRTKYTLVVDIIGLSAHNETAKDGETNAAVRLGLYPNHMEMEIWVEAHNPLGRVESEHLKKDALYFVKLNPPGNMRIVSEKSFPTSLLLSWTRPIIKEHLGKLTYEIRYCKSGAPVWTYVPSADIAEDIESFRFQNLQPHALYAIQVRCKPDREGYGYWSEWTSNATQRTPEGVPASKPDLWKIVSEGDAAGERRVQFISKDPVISNGKILKLYLRVQEQREKVRIDGEWEHFPVNGSDNSAPDRHRSITDLKEILLDAKTSLRATAYALNSVGRSPTASLSIPEKAHERPPVEEVRAWPEDGKLQVEWKPPSGGAVTEYVVEWVIGDVLDWQRENKSSRRTVIKGDLEKFVCYTVSVYPIYAGWTGRPSIVQAYVEERAPLEGPIVRLNGKPRRNEAELVWTELPPDRRQGFITHYNVSYTSGGEIHTLKVPPNITSYTLTSLTGNTKYDVWVSASTVKGYTKGFSHSFTTLKYAPGEIEFIVVGVSLGFLFFVVMTMFLCIYKRDVIKRNFWPEIPNPGESTIGNWSPDYPIRAENPKERCLSDVSVLDVDACDDKCVFEEDKPGLPLKKDKYLSEEHSSGIGGSSCMSSPRQSVSDSDEGGDVAETTASTVQYSSVVASSGYKGQTPSSQQQQQQQQPSPAVFSRSESTQPLLDSEENPDQDGSRQSQCFHRNHDGFDQLLEAEPPEELETMDFCPLEENGEQAASGKERAGPASSYMPQLGGYRPQ